jgi:hypothetical protein
MKKLALAPIALALLAAGCATEDKVAPAPAPVVVAPPQAPAPVVVAPSTPAGAVVVPATPATLRTGIGFIDSVNSAPDNAAVGGSAGTSTKRIGVRMADNSIQYLDTRAVGLRVGERVEITADGNLRRPVP